MSNGTIKTNKIFLISHNDLDGYGANVVVEGFFLPFSVEEVVEKNLSNDEVKPFLEEFFSEDRHELFDEIFIVDISPSLGTAKRIDAINKFVGREKVTLYDHHPTALELNQFSWANVVVGNYQSGTSLIFEALKERYLRGEFPLAVGDKNFVKMLQEFAYDVAMYDLWVWREFDLISSSRLNTLLSFYGGDIFVQECLSYIRRNRSHTEHFNLIYTKEVERLLEVREGNIQAEIEKSLRRVEKIEINKVLEVLGVETNDEGFVGVVMESKNISLLGNKICENDTSLKFALILNIYNDSISLRSLGEEYNVGELAKKLGGGGHKNASGFEATTLGANKYLELIKLIKF